MSDFDLDLRSVEDRIEADDVDFEGTIVLGILDGTTPGEEWFETVLDGDILVLSVEGDLNDLASDFARDVRDAGGHLVHFRGFLLVTPPGVDVDRERL